MTDSVGGSPTGAGVHRVLGDAGGVAIILRGRGWSVVVVPPARTDEQLWDGLSAALGLPAWFGRNLDALEEALAEIEQPTALVLAAWWTYARARPERWHRLLELLRERATADPPFLVALAD